MFALLAAYALCEELKPLILMPGLYGSQIYGTTEDFDTKYWYCATSLNDEVVWVDAAYVIPPLYNCLFEILEGYYDNDKGIISNKPKLDLHPHDYGGVEGIRKVIDVFGIKVMESFDSLIDYLLDKGYEVQKNLFGAPYDWRLAVAGLRHTTFFTDLKALCEKAYSVSKQKVTVLGYSLGGMMLSQFLGNTPEITTAWKNKYIDKAIFLAPAFAGAGDTLPVSWSQQFPIATFLQDESIKNAIMNMPCVHVLYPNHVVFKGDTIIITEDGTKLGPESVAQFFIDHQKLVGDSIKMLNKNLEISKVAPADPGVPLLMIYNSYIQTLIGLSFENGYDSDPINLYTSGDGTVPSKGPEWGCKNWAADKALICYDFKNSASDFNHGGLGKNAYVKELIYNYTNNLYDASNWQNQARSRIVTAPLVLSDEDNYLVMDDVRPQSEVDV
ncbi:Lecithin:cholesterol acyltransferase family protein [Histomonas meleagridis]|uniref:Lecithin:cholesterol acyltransferase family protein n=1 Tax=Histomonas meleagridis TaxID=135588 RepID=UPI0035598CA4|nr:Lecithin:cholesterol acyltransferase family protein [Histomonas meleagridis]KAH0805761.1 Lecithin:cholesterol acyltransferase family protein [Histomonas meleagridis]